MVNQIKQTGDGSHTLISGRFNQPYHSLGGAVAESRIVYFESTGLNERLASSEPGHINIMEIGFGSGLNLVLLLDYLQQNNSNLTVNFCSAEAYPLMPEVAAKVDFGESLEYLGYHRILKTIFSGLKSGWNSIEISTNTELKLFRGLFSDLTNPGDLQFDYVMHDPFSPDSNPAGWTPDLFKNVAGWSSENAMLSTYSAATSARAAMAVGGWKIARAPGALGKREMTVASRNAEKLSHLKRVKEEKLIRRWENGEFD